MRTARVKLYVTAALSWILLYIFRVGHRFLTFKASLKLLSSTLHHPTITSKTFTWPRDFFSSDNVKAEMYLENTLIESLAKLETSTLAVNQLDPLNFSSFEICNYKNILLIAPHNLMHNSGGPTRHGHIDAFEVLVSALLNCGASVFTTWFRPDDSLSEVVESIKFDLVIVCSVTAVPPTKSVITLLSGLRDRNFSCEVAGYITSSSTSYTLNALESWTKYLDYVICISNFQAQYFKSSIDIRVLVRPWWPSKFYNGNHSAYKSGVYFSGTLKWDRGEWLALIRLFAMDLGIPTKFRLFTHPMLQLFSELPSRSKFLEEKTQFEIGLVLTSREQGTCEVMLGSLLDTLFCGQIPFVQFDEQLFFDETLVPFVHFVPFRNLQELKALLGIYARRPELFSALRKNMHAFVFDFIYTEHMFELPK